MKTIFIVCFLLIFSQPSWSWDFAIQAGVGQTKLIGDVAPDIKEEIGYRYGLLVRHPLTDNLDLRTGLMYTYRKYQVSDFISLPPPFNTNTTSYEVQVSYLDGPILFQYNLLSWFSVYGGPVVAIPTKSRAKGNDASGAIDTDLKNATMSPYFLGQVGIGFDFGRIGLDLFYEQGFGEIFKGDKTNFSFIGMNLNVWLTRSDSVDDYDDYPSYRFR